MQKTLFIHLSCYEFPVLIYAGMIFFLSSLPQLPVVIPSFRGLDKLAHLVEYYLFGCLIYRWLCSFDQSIIRRNIFLITTLMGILYGLSDEWHQSFVPGRDATLWDVLFDALGVTAAAILYPIIHHKNCRKLHGAMGKGENDE
jgi:VanZ family protein